MRRFIFITVVVVAFFIGMQSLGQIISGKNSDPKDISVTVLTSEEIKENNLGPIPYCHTAVKTDTGKRVIIPEASPWRCPYISGGEQGTIQKVERDIIGNDGVKRRDVKYYYKGSN